MSNNIKAYQIEASVEPLNGTINLPASKSICNRVLIIRKMCEQPFTIHNLSDSDDTRVLDAVFHSDDPVFDVGHAGTAMRFLAAYLSRITGEWILTGSDRMKQRPIQVLVDALRQLGANIEYIENEGYPPIKIYGSHLKGGIVELDGSVSSQYISALLMIAPALEGGLTLKLKNRVASRSYIELTLKLMTKFGIRHSWKNNEIRVPEQTYLPADYTVESDWSAASYWYQLLTLVPSGEIKLKNLHISGLQGDEVVSHWFTGFGIETKKTGNGIKIHKIDYAQPLRIFLNFHENPDIAQTMAVLCVAKVFLSTLQAWIR